MRLACGLEQALIVKEWLVSSCGMPRKSAGHRQTANPQHKQA